MLNRRRHFSLLRSYPMVRRRELFYHFPVIDMTNPHLILSPGTRVVALLDAAERSLRADGRRMAL